MLNWAVIEVMYLSKFEGTRDRIIAQFDSYILAEDFINLVLPKETRDRFRIEFIGARR